MSEAIVRAAHEAFYSDVPGHGAWDDLPADMRARWLRAIAAAFAARTATQAPIAITFSVDARANEKALRDLYEALGQRNDPEPTAA